jgi:hypothetical protein
MTAHFVFNGINVIISYYSADIINELDDAAQQASSPTVTDYIIVYGVEILVSGIGLILAYKLFKSLCTENGTMLKVKQIFKKENRTSYDETQGRFFDPYIMVGILLCVIYICLYGL